MAEFIKKHKIKLGIACASLALAIGTFFVLPNDYKVFQKTANFEIELGSQIDQDISTYIWGLEDAVHEAKLDTSKVDTLTAGKYKLYVTIGDRSIPYDINIVDTVAPTFSINESQKYVAVNREYDASKFITDLQDLSNTSEVFFKVNDKLQKTISFNALGNQTVTLVAKDSSGNETTQNATLVVETPPRFMGLSDITIPVGADFDYKENFIVYDETDGFITSQVSIADAGVDLSKAGSYKITYSVVNSKGIDNQKAITITTSANASSDYKYATNLTSEDWDVLIDNGYFKYELLEKTNSDKDRTAEVVKPISINLTKIYSETKRGAGSAFIYKIEEDYLYGLSVEHVLSHIVNNYILTFHNDVSINTNLEYVHLGSNSELALFRIKTSNIPKETLLTLKEAYIDSDYYEKLTTGTSLILYVENHKYAPNFNRVVKTVNLTNVNEPNIDQFPYKYPALSTKMAASPGTSGGPIMDYQGRILGAVSYNYTKTAKDYYMKLDALDELIQKFNEKYN